MTIEEKLIRTVVAFTAIVFASDLRAAETLFVASPLTQGEFTEGIEGPSVRPRWKHLLP